MKTHSFLSKKCVVKKSMLAGIGVFARKRILKNELVAVWGGIVYTTKEVEKLARKFPIFNQSPVSVFDGFYIGPLNNKRLDDAERFNHNCDPNVGIKGQIIVLARRNIEPGEEICFDYDTTEISSVPFRCRCGAKKCRKIIDGTAWKNPKFVSENKKYLSRYLQEKLSLKS